MFLLSVVVKKSNSNVIIHYKNDKMVSATTSIASPAGRLGGLRHQRLRWRNRRARRSSCHAWHPHIGDVAAVVVDARYVVGHVVGRCL
jgi:hypothetical protein